MPFTANEFLDVFAAYNQAVWPFAAILWLLTTAGVRRRWSQARRYRHRCPDFCLPGTGCGPASCITRGSSPPSILPPGCSLRCSLRRVSCSSRSDLSARQAVDGAGSARRVVSSLLIVYSLIYPVVVWADGFVYPRMPTFGVPCPTVLLTIGVLLAMSRPSVLLSVIPVGWSLIAGTAAWLFGVHADFVLPAAGGVLVVDLILRRSHVMKKLSFASVFIVLVAMLVFVPASPALAQAAQHDHEQQAQKGGMKMDGMKMGEMKMDPKMMEEMAAKKKANTERITALMAQSKAPAARRRSRRWPTSSGCSSKSAPRCRNTARR